MPKPKWNLNTIYISERLQESLRPISRCALTTVVAPMGYGKTTAINWYLERRTKVQPLRIVRISVYSDNLTIFWKSVQDAFARAGFDFLRDYTCPTDAAGGGLLADVLCHELAGETACYIFIDDFHLLTDRRASAFLCMLANRALANVHLIVASRDRFLPAAEAVRLGAGCIRSARSSCASTIRSLPSMHTDAVRRFPMHRLKASSIPARAGSLPFI